MRILVTGASGMLGQDVVTEFRQRDVTVAAYKREGLDITDRVGTLRVVEREKPQVVINCAAYTDVDGAEAEPQRALLVNGLGPKNLALACRESGADLVQISTDYIFDGVKDSPYGAYDQPDPVNVYGKSKLWGERAVSSLLPNAYIVRTSWLFGAGGRNFVTTMLRLGREQKTLRVVDDQCGCPTYTADLARALADLVGTRCYGIYHVTNTGAATWYGFARSIFAGAGLAVELNPCSTGSFPRPARRPPNSMLDPFPLAETLGYLLPPWEDALERFLKSLFFPKGG